MDSGRRSEPLVERPVDAVALMRQRLRLAGGEVPWLHDEVARRMADRLPLIRLSPSKVLVRGPTPADSVARLRTAYPRARIDAVRPPGSTAVAGQRRWWQLRRTQGSPDAWVDAPSVPAQAAQMLWSNLELHWTDDLPTEIERWKRSLVEGGFLMFSTFGPGSLAPLAEVYRRAGWGAPFAPFVDMHDLGDMLVRAGFADPVMDQETLSLSWPGPTELLRELRGVGGNAAQGRFTGLRTPRWHARLVEALGAQAAGRDGRPTLPIEVVYGHAFVVAPRPRSSGETQVPVETLRAALRQRRA